MRIDCDIHPGVGNTAALFPWLNDHWREMSVVRGIEDLASINYPDRSPLTRRSPVNAIRHWRRRELLA